MYSLNPYTIEVIINIRDMLEILCLCCIFVSLCIIIAFIPNFFLKENLIKAKKFTIYSSIVLMISILSLIFLPSKILLKTWLGV